MGTQKGQAHEASLPNSAEIIQEIALSCYRPVHSPGPQSRQALSGPRGSPTSQPNEIESINHAGYAVQTVSSDLCGW
jgi:hypothetical protein